MTRSVFLLLISILPHAFAYDPLAAPKPGMPPQDFTIRDAARDREIPVRVYLPAEKKIAPVVLFSHGLGGSREGSAFLGRHWSARGYVCVFLQHHGSDEGVWKDKPLPARAAALMQAANAQNLLLRIRDVSAALDELERWNKDTGHTLHQRMNLSQTGMSGHSFGAQTTQAVSGQRFPVGPPTLEPRIKAAVIFSPSKPARGDTQRSFGEVKLPWLLMTGTKDVARIGPQTIGAADVESRLAVYPALPPGDKYELVLDEAAHFAFTDRPDFEKEDPRNPNHHRVILALSTAFWDAYLKNDAEAKAWLTGDAARKLMDEKDRWQRK